MPCKFNEGDVVSLNQYGIDQCFGAGSFEHMMLKEYVVTKTGAQSLIEIGEAFEVAVDDAALNKLMIDDRCFDLVRARTGFFAAPKGIDELRLKKAVDGAIQKFWEEIAKQYPETDKGDIDPGLSGLFDETAAKAAADWVRNNVPDTKPDNSDRPYAW